MGLGRRFSRVAWRVGVAGLLAAAPAWLGAQTPVRVLYDFGYSGTNFVTLSPTNGVY